MLVLSVLKIVLVVVPTVVVLQVGVHSVTWVVLDSKVVVVVVVLML